MAGTLEHIHRVAVRRGAPEELAGLVLEPERGLAGDHHDRPGNVRPVTLIDAELLEEVAKELGIALPAGASRRNLTLRGVHVEGLGAGTLLAIGGAQLELLGVCAPCRRMEEALGAGALASLRGRGGVAARVVSGGAIRQGDTVEVARRHRRRVPALPSLVARVRGWLVGPA